MMGIFNMQPLPGQDVSTPVLHIDLTVGHSALMEAADNRFFMLRTITDVIQCSHIDPGAIDLSDVIKVLHTLVNEAHGLCGAAYRLAVDASVQTSKGDA